MSEKIILNFPGLFIYFTDIANSVDTSLSHAAAQSGDNTLVHLNIDDCKTKMCETKILNAYMIYERSCIISLRMVVGWLFGFYGISTFVGYLMPNPFFMKIVLFQTIQFSISTQFKCKYRLIVKNVSISSFSVYSSSSNSANSVVYKYRFFLLTVKCQNSSILNNSV